MPRRYWTCYWREKHWLNNPPHEPLRGSGGSFSKRGVLKGDVVYVVSQRAGQLLLGGRMTVARITTREDAVRIFDNNSLYKAHEWVIAGKGSGTPLHLHRKLAPEVTKHLRFLSGKSGGSTGLLFVNDHHLDRQTTRIVRELAMESVSLLDEIIEMTDKLKSPITITDRLLRKYRRGCALI